jgi:hypothetical protein
MTPIFGGYLENSTSHIFCLFEFIFSMVGSYVLLSVKINIKMLHISLLYTIEEKRGEKWRR